MRDSRFAAMDPSEHEGMPVGLSLEMSPAQCGREPGEVRIRRNPFTAAFDCQCRVSRIGDEFASNSRALAQLAEYSPMSATRPDECTRRKLHQCVQELKSLLCTTGGGEDAGIR